MTTDAAASKSTQAAPAAASESATPAAASTDTEALQLNQVVPQDASVPPAASQQPSEQAQSHTTATTNASARDSKAAAAQQQPPASSAAAAKAPGQEQKQQQAESASAKQGSGGRAEAAPSSAGGAWGGVKSFRDIAAGNKPEKVGPPLYARPCAHIILQHLDGFLVCRGFFQSLMSARHWPKFTHMPLDCVLMCFKLSLSVLKQRLSQSCRHGQLEASLCSPLVVSACQWRPQTRLWSWLSCIENWARFSYCRQLKTGRAQMRQRLSARLRKQSARQRLTARLPLTRQRLSRKQRLKGKLRLTAKLLLTRLQLTRLGKRLSRRGRPSRRLSRRGKPSKRPSRRGEPSKRLSRSRKRRPKQL